MFIKKMELVKSIDRSQVDLKPYAKDIENGVREVIPNAIVRVYKDYYETETDVPITNIQARVIGRKIAKGSLIRNFITIYRYGSI